LALIFRINEALGTIREIKIIREKLTRP